MKTLKFQGYSDDTFSCIGLGVDVDHDDCAQGTLRAIEISSPSDDRKMVVVGQFAPPKSPGSWWIGVQCDDDDGYSVPWPTRYAIQSSDIYSPTLIVDAPDDAIVRLIRPRKEDS